jgi:2-amino-4-hydroxy-6-hydroxymethyldihydropteridine diphosphokinase
VAIEAALGLGGNLGDPVAAFAAALKAMEHHPTIRLMRLSSVWRTAPWGKLDQPEFLNMAALIETNLTADELLALCLSVERENGRERSERWGPRTLDIDILTYGNAIIDQPGLQIPHPRIAERAFVLAPLAEIAPDLTILGRSVQELWIANATESVQQDGQESARLESLISVLPTG